MAASFASRLGNALRLKVQILESALIGLRSARILLASPDSPVSITLFPMVHVGEAAFYDAVYEEAAKHDVILIEGVNSPIAKRITRSYRWLVGDRLGLVLQPRFPTAVASGEVVLADLSHEEFVGEWRRVPMWLRLAVYGLAPFVGLRGRLLASRESLAKGHNLEDNGHPDEFFDVGPAFLLLQAAIVSARDRRLVERLCEHLDRTAPPSRIAVVYGAGHIPAVIRALTKERRFRPVAADWQVVFGL